MPVLSHHFMANLLVLDPSMGRIWPNKHSYGCALTKPTAIPLYYDYINHLNTLPLSTRLTAYPTTSYMIFLSLQIRQNEIRAPSFFGRCLIIYDYKRDASPNYVLERVKTCICLRFITISYMYSMK